MGGSEQPCGFVEHLRPRQSKVLGLLDQRRATSTE
jgi:hypothetical protein